MIPVYIDSQSAVPIYKQIVNQIGFLISSGMLKKSERLPSVRDFAKSLSVNPMTISRAYSELEREKAVYGLRGKGVYVSPFPGVLRKRERVAMLEKHMKNVICEAKGLNITQKEVVEIARKLFKECDKG